MASKPCVQRTYTVEAPTVVPPNSLEWVAYLALRFIHKSLWQPRGSSLERNGPAGIPWQQSGTQPWPWQLRVHARMLVCVR